jgi:hypothetical protein
VAGAFGFWLLGWLVAAGAFEIEMLALNFEFRIW